MPTSAANDSLAVGYSTDAKSSNTPSPNRNAELDPWAPWNLLPLGTLAAELNVTSDALAHQLDDDQILLDDIGLRCITRATAHAVIAEQRAREQAQRERDAIARQELNARTQAARERRARRRAELKAQRATEARAAAEPRGIMYDPERW